MSTTGRVKHHLQVTWSQRHVTCSEVTEASPGVYLSDAGAAEGHDDGHHVHRELELEELGDAVVDVPPPHHRLHDAAEVIIGQDDVRRFFSHVGSSYALKRDQEEEPETRRRSLEPGGGSHQWVM